MKDMRTFKSYNKLGQKLICFNENSPDLYLQGTFESLTAGKSSSVAMLSIDRCRNSTKCASNDKIDDWLFDKTIYTGYIGNSPNFVSFDKHIHHEKKMVATFPMTTGKTRFLYNKFRKNVYERKDNWLWASEEEDSFYDFQPLSDYHIDVPPKTFIRS